MKPNRFLIMTVVVLLLLASPPPLFTQAQLTVQQQELADYTKNSYTKREVMPGIVHTFRKGHRIMVQIQSTWFPLVARNPQKFMPNYKQGTDADFQRATERVYRNAAKPSRIILPVVKR